MSVKKIVALALTIAVCGLISTKYGAQPKVVSQEQPITAPEIQSTTAEELKAKVTKNQPVTIIDVRASEGYADSQRKIKGAIHVKLRRLRYRLGFEPLKSVSHDSEVVTYCACPNDEASIKAAQVLMDAGFKRVRFLKGGWREWQKLKGPIEAMPKG